MDELMKLKYEFALAVKQGLSLSSEEADNHRAKINELENKSKS